MVTVLDEYLGDFICDIGRGITTFVSFVEFILGVSYFCGQKLAEWILAAGFIVAEVGSQISEIALAIGSELFDFGGGVVRGVLLIYYGIWMLFEAFYLCAVDLKAFSIHVISSVSQLLAEAQSALLYHFHRSFVHIPTHICDALVFVGDTAISCFVIIGHILKDFLTQLVLAPINVFKAVGYLLYKITSLPAYIVDQIPLAAHVGLLVITIFFLAYWKLSIFSLLRKIPYVIRKTFAGIVKIFSFLRNFKRIVQEIVNSGGSYELSGSSKDTKALCVICQDATVSFISVPCKHVCLCYSCVKTLVGFDNRCPLCRGVVTKFEKVFIPE